MSVVPAAQEVLLDVVGLETSFETGAGLVRAVDGVSLRVPRGASIGVVGESGCGKSVMSLSVLRLISSPGKITGGKILFEGRDLLALSDEQMRKLRGKSIAMIFQEPMTALNPVYTVGQQIGEVLQLHEGLDKNAARTRSVELLRMVGIPAPEQRVDSHPHELSGGMRQRVMIAMSIACRPKLLIADEPTTALDVTIQAQILDLLARLRKELGMSIVLITHDLGVVAEFVDEVVVMYAGRVVEHAPTSALFSTPLHPYTQGLLASVPGAQPGDHSRLRTIEGMVPDLARLPPGCRFRERCPRAVPACADTDPKLVTLGSGRAVACLVAQQEAGAHA